MTPLDESPLLFDASRSEAAGDLDQAIRVLRGGIAQHPSFFRSRLELSRLLFLQEDFPGAVQAVQVAEQHDPLTTEFGAIQRAMQAGNSSQAATIAQDMLAKIPGHPRAIFTLASIAQQRDDHEASALALEDSLAVAPANLSLRQMLIGALESSGQYRRALEEARLIIRVDPSFASQMTLAAMLFRLGQTEGAKEACEEARRSAGQHKGQIYEAEILYAQILRVVGEKDACLQSFKRCLRLNPGSGDAWWGLADLKTYAFDEQELSTLRTVSAHPGLDPVNKSMATFALAKALEGRGQHDKSMQAYRVPIGYTLTKP